MFAKSDSEGELAPLAVKVCVAAALMSCSVDRVYKLIRRRELRAFKDGRSTKVEVASIRERQARLLTENPVYPTDLDAQAVIPTPKTEIGGAA
jgi:excisionase family DNA binding protein